MGIVDSTLGYIKRRRQNLIDGKVNCIPSPFKSFWQDFVGIEQETYYCVTANQKAAKSQFTSFMFIYTPILYAYENPDKVRVKIFYAPLEESQLKATMRFMRHLLYVHSKFKIRVSQNELASTIEGHPIDEKVIERLESEEYRKILDFFEERIEYLEAKNPTGIYKRVKEYHTEHGKRITQPITITDEFGNLKTVNKLLNYEPDDPDEYVIILADHVGLLQEESGKDKRQTIRKYSEYMMELRDDYRDIPVIVQQQSSEVQSMDAFKLNRISPTPGALADCKDTRYDVNVMMGLTNPFAAHLETYPGRDGYDITKLRDNVRFFEMMLSRDGTANAVKALYFDGAVSYFKELPGPKSPGYEEYMEKVYSLIQKNREESARKAKEKSE
jgi:hypothetical protein